MQVLKGFRQVCSLPGIGAHRKRKQAGFLGLRVTETRRPEIDSWERPSPNSPPSQPALRGNCRPQKAQLRWQRLFSLAAVGAARIASADRSEPLRNP